MLDILKKNLLKAGIFIAVGTSFLYNNEKKWQERLELERLNFEKEKDVLLNKINELSSRDTSFRFYEHFANGADFAEIKKIEEMRFVNTRVNPYGKYRPQPLSEELIVKNDTVLNKRIHDSKLFDAREKAFANFRKSNSLDDILENGNLFLKATLDIMSKHNHAMGGTLVRALKHSDQQNEREFKARYFMFELKTKNKMYENAHDLTVDFYKTVFLKNMAQYKTTAAYLTSLCDSLDAVYQKDVLCDSLQFEKQKTQKIDSIVHAKPVYKMLTLEKQGFNLPTFQLWRERED